jgi:tetraacyldisaccharide 4'-kinase
VSKYTFINLIEKNWYGRQRWTYLLLPFSVLFAVLTSLRRLAYKLGIKKQHKIAAPIIVVGNISVGGNGKTPLVIRIAELLKQQGFHPGVLSRGYGGEAPHYPFAVQNDSSVEQVGDEPYLMRQRVSCPIVVDPDRARGASYLVENMQCDVVICDDGLQHYRLQRDIEIAVVDGTRQQGNGQLLPAGPLREGKWRLDTVDFVVLNGGQASGSEHLMALEAGQLVNVKFSSRSKGLSQLHKSIVAVAGIGNPQRFFSFLEHRQVKIKETLSFPDHHHFQQGDIPDDTVVMTEKDAVKCRNIANEDWWYLPVSAKLPEQFEQALLTKLGKLKSR